jgi:DNA-binding PadR family transcriptional regulator
VLAALLAEPQTWRYGYDLAKETGLASGTLYPVLMRLAGRGYLDTEWETPVEGRPRRHLYRLSQAGLDYAADAVVNAPKRSILRMRPVRGTT